jgi:type IV fimbrial biogenesis protein FimT
MERHKCLLPAALQSTEPLGKLFLLSELARKEIHFCWHFVCLSLSQFAHHTEPEFDVNESGFMSRWEFKAALADIRGFSVAEMMATMGVFAVLMAVAVPSFLAFRPSMQLNGASREMLGKLMWARSKAVEQNSTYIVTFPSNHELQIFNDTNNNSTLDAGEWTQTIDLQTDYADVTFSQSGATPTFNSRGTSAGTTTITLNNESGSKTVTVTPTGSVKIGS